MNLGSIGSIGGAAAPQVTQGQYNPASVSEEVLAQKIQEQRNWDLRHKFEILCQAQAIRDDTKLMDEIRQWVRAEKAKIIRQLDALGM